MPADGLRFIVRSLLKRSNILTDNDIVTSGLLDHKVQGFVIKNQKSIRNAIGELQKLFFFDGNEQDFKLHIESRGKSQEIIVLESEMGSGVEMPQENESVEITRETEISLPQELIYEAMNIDNDYWGHIERSQRLVIEQNDKNSVKLSIVVTAEQLAKAVQIGHSTIWVERDKCKMTVMRKFTDVTVGTILNFVKKGVSHRFRINSIETAISGLLVFEGHREEVGQFDSVQAGSFAGRGNVGPVAIGNTIIFYLDAPMLRSADDDTGFSVTLARESRFVSWKGSNLYISKDDAIFGVLDNYIIETPHGVLKNNISNSNFTTWTGQIMKISLANGALFSASKPDVLGGSNAGFLLDPNGDVEYIQWTTATDNGDGTYDVTGLLRGRRGTELQINSHTVDVVSTVDIGSVPGESSITFTSTLNGVRGDKIRIEFLTPIDNLPLVESGVDANGIIRFVVTPDNQNKTAQDVIDLVNSDAFFASACMATNTTGSDGTGNVAVAAETALTGGIDGTKFGEIQDGNTKHFPRDVDEIGLQRHFKAVTIGQNIDNIISEPYTNIGKVKFPYAPSNVKGARNGAGDITITWRRRTRFGGAWKDLVDVPLNESTESYEVDIMNGAAVVRVITGLTLETTIYLATDQVTDFGSNQDPLTIRVFQISAIIGRGFKREEII